MVPAAWLGVTAALDSHDQNVVVVAQLHGFFQPAFGFAYFGQLTAADVDNVSAGIDSTFDRTSYI
jgi:hypothetical protein